MYHKASISPLSSTQISKILNGHSVRVSAGNGHDIELSKEQLKKFSRAHKSGKGMTLTMDPYQIQIIKVFVVLETLKKLLEEALKD